MEPKDAHYLTEQDIEELKLFAYDRFVAKDHDLLLEWLAKAVAQKRSLGAAHASLERHTAAKADPAD